MVFGMRVLALNIAINSNGVEVFNNIVYHGNVITTDNKCNIDIKRSIGTDNGILCGYNKISLQIKFPILKLRIISAIIGYGLVE